MINDWITSISEEVSKELHNISEGSSGIGGFGLKNRVSQFILAARSALYPNIYQSVSVQPSLLQTFRSNHISSAAMLLFDLASEVFTGINPNLSRSEAEARSEHIVKEFISSLPSITALLSEDVTAAYEGDPAAVSEEEIMLAYPAFDAISIYRMAHRLYELKLPLIPRMMTEQAHASTGIDIHPGATIGRKFFIDHGTGVVIGETTVIGDRVKLYQCVTLGAKSFENDENGNPIKGIKRHPNIGNDVIIYSGASILGGTTVIGDNCVIGGNVWLTHSVPAGTTVIYGKE